MAGWFDLWRAANCYALTVRGLRAKELEQGR